MSFRSKLPDQRQLAAACQLVIAVEAAAVSQAMDDRAPAGLRPAGSDAAAETGWRYRACPISKRCAGADRHLSAHLAAVAGVDAVIAPVAPVAAPTIAESDVGNQPRRRSG